MEVRDYIAGDEKKILDLFKLVFKKELSPAYWKWRFLDNPQKKVQIKLMFDGEILAGHYAVSPVELVLNGELFNGALSMTTMTHPDYAGKGIFTKLASELYEDYSSKKQLSIVYGFPNANSHYGFINKLGWVDSCTVPTYSFEPKSKLTTSTAKQFFEFNVGHEKSLAANYVDYDLYLNRLKSWLNWRYFQNPSSKYVAFMEDTENPCDFIVAKLFKGLTGYEIDICELVCNDISTLSNLINAVCLHYSDEQISKINIWIPENDTSISVLSEFGFKPGEPLTKFGYRILDENINYMPKHIYFSMGDSDIY